MLERSHGLIRHQAREVSTLTIVELHALQAPWLNIPHVEKAVNKGFDPGSPRRQGKRAVIYTRFLTTKSSKRPTCSSPTVVRAMHSSPYAEAAHIMCSVALHAMVVGPHPREAFVFDSRKQCPGLACKVGALESGMCCGCSSALLRRIRQGLSWFHTWEASEE